MSLLSDPPAGDPPANPPAGSPPPTKSWQETAGISEEYRNNPTVSQAKDINGLVKSAIEAQAMVGKDKFPAPTDKWTDSDWAQHYDRLGRPETAADYGVPDTSKWENLPDGFEVNNDGINKFKESLHKHGISKKQGEAIISDILQGNLGEYRDNLSKSEQARNASIASLKEEFGADFDSKITVARAVLKQYGNEDLSGFLEHTGLADNADLVRFLTKIGSTISEDNASGGTNALHLDSKANAMQELEQLKQDPDFMKRTWNTEDPGHRAAKDRWMRLNELAYPKAS